MLRFGRVRLGDPVLRLALPELPEHRTGPRKPKVGRQRPRVDRGESAIPRLQEFGIRGNTARNHPAPAETEAVTK